MPADPADSAVKQPAAAESPYLLDHLPFKEEDVTAVTAKSDSGSVQVPAERQAALLQSLRLTDMQGAAVKESPEAERKPVVLQFALKIQATS